jgi:hypothetical protein
MPGHRVAGASKSNPTGKASVLQAKGIFGFVSNAVSNNSCALEVVFTKSDKGRPLDTIRLKALGKHSSEELPLLEDATGHQVCGQVRSVSPYLTSSPLCAHAPCDVTHAAACLSDACVKQTNVRSKASSSSGGECLGIYFSHFLRILDFCCVAGQGDCAARQARSPRHPGAAHGSH